MHNFAMKLVVFLPLALYLLIQLLYLDLLAIHLSEVRPESYLTLQVTDLCILTLHIVTESIKLA